MACTHTNIDCGCKDSFLTSPAPCPTPEGCPDPQPCSEVFDSQCIVYTDSPIICNQDTVVATNDTVETALQEIVNYFCSKLDQCCPTFAVEIRHNRAEQYELEAITTNGTAPFTYQWSFAQDQFGGFDFAGVTNLPTTILTTVPNYYYNAPALGADVYQSLVKVKVTDANGQIATAYYSAVFLGYQ
jgi:hypothetical protein